MDPAGEVGVRRPLIARAVCDLLAEADAPLKASAVVDMVRERVGHNPYEAQRLPSGGVRGDIFVSWVSAYAAKVGWIAKHRGSWTLTELGREQLRLLPPDEDLWARLRHLYHEVTISEPTPTDPRERLALIRRALELTTEGTWTSFTDLAGLVGTTGGNVGIYLWRNKVPNVHRVLTVDGRRITGDLSESANYDQLADQIQLLEEEGVEFVDGRASVAQRVSTDEFRGMLAEAGEVVAVPSRRAWLVRGSNVNGVNLVPVWLAKSSCSIAATQLRAIEPPLARREIAALVEEDYAHVSYNARNEKTAEFDTFLNRIQVGDLVATTSEGAIFVGEITGEPQYVRSGDGRSNLRRGVDWLNPAAPTDFAGLPASLQAKLSSQHAIIDLTNELAMLDRLVGDVADDDVAESLDPVATAEADLVDATSALATRLLVDQGWLQEVIELLRDRRQLIFYGPPGTGKTYLAQAIAEHVTDPEAVKLVQFHPAYSYEDFFEGFRPTVGEGGTVGFTLSPGPFRRLVDAARENPGTPYVLVIDEINRANLAKVFGELYFLLEYRDRSIDLLYSSGDEASFTMPRNVYLIGTMNTADRSIALVDAAMRRRFAFVPLHPSESPTSGLLRRWLEREGRPGVTADLLEHLNRLIEDDDFKIGPSYFMSESVYGDGGLARLWRTGILPLLEEHHYGDGTDVEKRYALERLVAAVGAGTEEPDEPDGLG